MARRLPEPYQRGKVFYFTYTAEDGRRRQRSTGCTTKKDAREEIEQFFAQPGSHITTDAFAHNFFVPGKCPWLAAKQKSKKKLKPAQIRNKRNHLTKWILPEWGRWKLEAITPRKYRDWLYSLPCKAQTQRHIHYTMQAILQEAVIADAVGRNVAKEVSPPSVDDAEHRDAFTAQEMLMLFPHSPLDIERHIMLEDDPDIPSRYGQKETQNNHKKLLTACLSGSKVVHMEEKTTYIPVAAPEALKTKVRSLAKQERRSMSQQALELLELGLAEYERRQEQATAVAAGKTQINPELMKKSGV